MQNNYSRESFLRAWSELLQVLEEHGIPEEVGKVIAKNLHSEKSIRRMTAYMKAANPTTMEQVADEMIAIMEDRQRWIEKKQTEESNMRYNAWLNSDLRED